VSFARRNGGATKDTNLCRNLVGDILRLRARILLLRAVDDRLELALAEVFGHCAFTDRCRVSSPASFLFYYVCAITNLVVFGVVEYVLERRLGCGWRGWW
jgi:hypothetical protein